MLRDEKTAVITGAGSGIGRALAREAAAAGYRVILTGRRVSALEETRSLLPSAASATVIPADLTVPADRARLIAGVATATGRCDLLINNAGIVPAGPLGDMTDETLTSTISINLVAPMALTRDFLPLMRAAGRARIVNVGSLFGDIGFPLFPVYSASKFGLRGFSDAIRREWKDFGIGVTYAAPRATRTAATDAYDHLVPAFGMKIDECEHVARQIFRAAESGRRSVYPRGPERLFTLVQRLFPALIDGAVVRQLRNLSTAERKSATCGTPPLIQTSGVSPTLRGGVRSG